MADANELLQIKDETTAKGLERTILKIVQGVLKFETKVNKVFFGDPKKKNKILKKGVYRILQELNGIPLCEVFTYLLSRVKFPKNPVVQKIDEIIDKVNSIVTKASNTLNDINRGDLSSFTSERLNPQGQLTINTISLNEEQSKALNELRQELDDVFTPDILSTLAQIPAGEKVRNTINNLLAYLNNVGTLTTLPTSKFQNLQKYIDDLQSILYGLRLATGPSLALIPGLSTYIDQLNKFMDPTKLIPFIKSLIKILNTLNRGIRSVIKVARTLRAIAKILRVTVKALKFILKILKTIPIPNKVTTVGITTTAAQKMLKAEDKLNAADRRVSQLNTATSVIVGVMRGLASKIDLIIIELQKLLLTIQGCSIFDQEIEDLLKNTIESFQKTKEELQNQINDLSPDDQSGRIRIGKYSIEILEEKVVDRGITLKRRRAIAFDEKGVLILEGTPTFATDTNVIIEELKLKLNIQNIESDESIDNIGVEDIFSDESIFEIQDLDNPEEQDQLEEDQQESQQETIDWIKTIPGGNSRLNKIKEMILKRRKRFQQKTTSGNTNSNQNKETFIEKLIKRKK